MAQQQTVKEFGQLYALQPEITPQEYTLQDDMCILGRSADCHIVIPGKTVSRLHAQIERKGPRYLLSDTGSVNGTYVNNQRIYEPHMLKSHDLIGLGSTTAALRFVDPDPTSSKAEQLRYDERTMTFILNGQTLDLSPILFRLLLHLYQYAGQVCTRESCAEAMWGRDYDPGLDSDALNRNIGELRRRLRQVDEATECIQSRRGLGYVLNL